MLSFTEWVFDTKWKRVRRVKTNDTISLEEYDTLKKKVSRNNEKNLIQGVIGSTFAIFMGGILLSQESSNGLGWILIAIGILGEVFLVKITHDKLTELDERITGLENSKGNRILR